MADFDDAIKRQSARPLRGQENQVVRYMAERFVSSARLWPAFWKFAGYIGTAATVGVGILAFWKALQGL